MVPSVIPASNVEGSGLDIGPSVIWGVIVEGPAFDTEQSTILDPYNTLIGENWLMYVSVFCNRFLRICKSME